MLGDTSRTVEKNVIENEVLAPGKASRMVGEIFEDDEVTLERYEQAAKSKLWRESMDNERNALKIEDFGEFSTHQTE